ncbi:MAG: hypothetical protein QM770_04800 [Tepidisphaeraceae bacterium]
MPSSKVKLATMWLDGCSGCHMSFLDMDELLLEIAPLIELVWSPIVDVKPYPDQIDVMLVEGAASTDEDCHKLREFRKRAKLMVALGDCAVTGNVPSMRNGFKLKEVFDRAYVENATVQAGQPTMCLPVLEKHARPIHEIVPIDLFVPGCPPPASAIYQVLSDLLNGKTPEPTKVTRFGK